MNTIDQFKKSASVEAVVQPDGYLRIDPYMSDEGQFITNAAHHMVEWMKKNPECVGRKVRITIELVPTPEETAQVEAAQKAFDERLNKLIVNQLVEKIEDGRNRLMGDDPNESL